MQQLIKEIYKRIDKDKTNIIYYEDIYKVLLSSIENKDIKQVVLKESINLRNNISKLLTKDLENNNIIEFVKLSNDLLRLEAPYLLDSYLLYLEHKRPTEEQFYLPRRKILKEVVDNLQALVDDELDELFISMPPRVGKTTLLLFFTTWILGRNSELSNLYSAYSDTITSAFYRGVLEIITDEYTYCWKDIFANSKIVETNAQSETLNIDRKKRYPSLTCRSLYGTLNGACDCGGFLISDDLLGGIEEALNKDRLISAWTKVDNNLITRAKQQAKILWCGTRWSLHDPIGLRQDNLINGQNFKDRRYKIITLPALNENEESNFDYAFNVGFDTTYYRQRRESFERNGDIASWMAQYQGEPIERDGALFSVADLKYYNGILPKRTPDRVFMAVDVAFGGGDFLSAPICYQFEDEIYIADWIFNNGDKNITRPLLINKILEHKVKTATFEKNNGGGEYQEFIEMELRNKGYRLNITSKYAPTNKRKEERIYENAPQIREFYFLEDGKRTKEYQQAMNNLYSFKIQGKNKNDDAPDSLAMACDMINSKRKNGYEILKRLF